jgi:transglutaminase-like putative cysteine protease
MQTTTSVPPRTRGVGAPPVSAPWLRLLPEDGFLTLTLLVVVVYTTIASIQSVTPPWAPGLQILTFTTGIGLLLGYIAVQQGRLPAPLLHGLAMVLGTLFAFQQTADAVLGGNRGALWSHTAAWFQVAIVKHESSDDNRVFLLFLAILSFLLAYISIWLVLHTRRPWLAALANGVVLLINLGSTGEGEERVRFFLVLFLLTTLLLLVRFTLAENVRHWRMRGLRFSPDLGWDFMQAGAIFAVIVLLLADLLPSGPGDAAVQAYWSSPDNPWQKVENAWQALFNGVHGGKNGSGVGFFGSGLKLVGNVDLPDIVILRYKLGNPNTDDASQYLITETLDTFNGEANWSQSPTLQPISFPAGAFLPSSTANSYRINSYLIHIERAPDSQHLFAPGDEAASFSVPSQTYVSDPARIPTQWVATSTVNSGADYQAQGYASTATQDQLRAVPYPKDLPSADLEKLYPAAVLNQYLPTTTTVNQSAPISPDVAAKAQEVTKGAANMYDAALKIEDYLRTFKYSTHNPDPPAGQDAVSWFLKEKQGFCSFFAAAMALMGRSLGMPTRLAAGFTKGEFEASSGTFVVKGTASHVWTQIYFANYGWINFEPTSSFDKFFRAENNGTQVTPTPLGGGGPGGPRPTRGPKDQPPPENIPGGSSSPANPVLIDVGLGLSLLIVLLLLCGALFMIWWRLLYRGLSPVAAAFARVARLGTWAGAPPTRSQTPDEYAERLSEVIPGQRGTLHRLSGLYARERWGGGATPEGTSEIARLYNQVRLSVFPVIMRRLRHIPALLLSVRRRARRTRGRTMR